MLSTQRKFSIGYFMLTVLGLWLIQIVFFAPQSENLSCRDFKTLLKAGKVVDLLLKERTITGRLSAEPRAELMEIVDFLKRPEHYRRLGGKIPKGVRFFETFVGPEDHTLPPDNCQEEPQPVVAHRTSPTNLGLYLLSTIAAHDFGWLGTLAAVERLEATLGTMHGLARFRGHFYNWYDTRDLRPRLGAGHRARLHRLIGGREEAGYGTRTGERGGPRHALCAWAGRPAGHPLSPAGGGEGPDAVRLSGGA